MPLHPYFPLALSCQKNMLIYLCAPSGHHPHSHRQQHRVLPLQEVRFILCLGHRYRSKTCTAPVRTISSLRYFHREAISGSHLEIREQTKPVCKKGPCCVWTGSNRWSFLIPYRVGRKNGRSIPLLCQIRYLGQPKGPGLSGAVQETRLSGSIQETSLVLRTRTMSGK